MIRCTWFKWGVNMLKKRYLQNLCQKNWRYICYWPTHVHDTLKITHFRLMCFKEKLEEKHDSHLYLHYEKKPINTFLYFSSGLKKEFQTLIICLVHNLPWARGSYVNWTQEDQCKGNFNVQFQKRVWGFHLGIQTQENWW